MSWFVKDYVAIGRKYERERIIELLKSLSNLYYGEFKEHENELDSAAMTAIDEAIIVIKGENE